MCRMNLSDSARPMHSPSCSFFRWMVAPAMMLAATLRGDGAPGDGIREWIRKLPVEEMPGASVLIARDGKVLFQAGYGMADLPNQTPVTPETKFRIGSVTKQFTAAAILRLVDEGKLSLNDPLSNFFSGFTYGDVITVHHLLTHTSGIRSYTDQPDFMAHVTKPVSPEELISRIRQYVPEFIPGSRFHYNNSAYFLAGEIVARVSGRPFAAYLRETFFEPLGMRDTGIYVNASPPPGMALGYAIDGGKANPAIDWDMSWAGGAGALYSTVGDLLRWNEGLYGGKVIKEASLKLQTSPISLPEGVDGMRYGCGLIVSEYHGLPMLSHSGGLHGWLSDLLWLPEQRCTVVALVNAMPSAPGHNPGSLTRRLVDAFLAAEIKNAPELTIDPAVDPTSYPAIAGRYDYKSGVMTVTAEKNQLFAQLTGQPKFEIFPKGPDEFFWKGLDARVAFLRNDKGEVTAARHTQNGSVFKAPRLTTEEVKLTAAELDAIAGQYQYGPGLDLTVTNDKSMVFAQLTGQPRFPIFPKSATEFEWRVVDATVEFIKDEKGNVTKAIHRQGGGTIEAPKRE
jgi:CubicO group peptidase (beta-lactamase class C family)